MMPTRRPRPALRDLFRHGGIDLSDARAETHRSALARVDALDRQLSDLGMASTPIPVGAPWPRDDSGWIA